MWANTFPDCLSHFELGFPLYTAISLLTDTDKSNGGNLVYGAPGVVPRSIPRVTCETLKKRCHSGRWRFILKLRKEVKLQSQIWGHQVGGQRENREGWQRKARGMWRGEKGKVEEGMLGKASTGRALTKREERGVKFGVWGGDWRNMVVEVGREEK